MTAQEELNLITTLLRKYNLPISPILEYAIQERISDLTSAATADDKQEAIGVAEPECQIAYDLGNGTIEERFEKYLCVRKSQGTAKYYTGKLGRAIPPFLQKIVSPDAVSVYSYTTVKTVKTLIAKLKSSEEFLKENDRCHHALSASLNAYLHFIEEIEQ